MNQEQRETEETRFKDHIYIGCDPMLSPHFVSIKQLAEKVGCSIKFQDDALTLRQFVLIKSDQESSAILDRVRVMFTYDEYRILNMAFQGLVWFDELNDKISAEIHKDGQ